METVRVAGVGLTKFGSSPERTGRDLFAEAGTTALADAGVDRDDVEEVYYGNFMGELAEHQGHQGPLMAEAVGVDAPATRFETACASAGAAVRAAVKDLRNGEADVILVGGAERMTNLGTAGATEALAIAADDLWEVRAGMTFPGAYALMAEAYFDEYGGTREDLGAIAIKNHANAVDNDLAQYQREITMEDVLDAPMVSSPLGLYDSCPISDGAAVTVLVSEDYAEREGIDAPVAITGTGQGGDKMALHDREHYARSPAADEAADEAYADASITADDVDIAEVHDCFTIAEVLAIESLGFFDVGEGITAAREGKTTIDGDAGITADDVDIAEVHDCFTIAEVLAIESLGFFDVGEGITAAREGKTTIDGDLPVNLSGGLKAKGHPVGATGVAQVAELADLLRGEHVHSDSVADAEVGVAHNAGGTVASAVVHVLEVVA